MPLNVALLDGNALVVACGIAVLFEGVGVLLAVFTVLSIVFCDLCIDLLLAHSSILFCFFFFIFAIFCREIHHGPLSILVKVPRSGALRYFLDAVGSVLGVDLLTLLGGDGTREL